MPATHIRKGMILKVDGELFRVAAFNHVTPGKGNAVMQTKLKNLKTGSITDVRFRSTEKVEKAVLEQKSMEYLYKDGESHIFMDSETYDQIPMGVDLVEDALPFLKENSAAIVVFHDGSPLGIDLPKTVDLEVQHTDPGLKTATATNVGKPATMETGLVITVPHFINIGDVLKIDTEEKRYVERVSNA